MNERNGVLENHAHRGKDSEKISSPRKESTPCDGDGKRK